MSRRAPTRKINSRIAHLKTMMSQRFTESCSPDRPRATTRTRKALDNKEKMERLYTTYYLSQDNAAHSLTTTDATSMEHELIASEVARITDGLPFDLFPGRLQVVWQNLHVFTLPLHYFFWTRLSFTHSLFFYSSPFVVLNTINVLAQLGCPIHCKPLPPLHYQSSPCYRPPGVNERL
jgi:hypothetical protein